MLMLLETPYHNIQTTNLMRRPPFFSTNFNCKWNVSRRPQSTVERLSSHGRNSPRGQPTIEFKHQLLLQGQFDLRNYAIRHSYTYNRWLKVATFIIRKDSNSSKMHRLRVIHLYEADLNLLLGVKWRSLFHHCIDHSLLNAGQFGGLPGRDATTSVFLEELQWETTRASRHSLLCMDFDAASCCDRIISSIASLAVKIFRQHKALFFIYATFLRRAKYVLKTKLGLSDEGFGHINFFTQHLTDD
jgi:hypothetical protein